MVVVFRVALFEVVGVDVIVKGRESCKIRLKLEYLGFFILRGIGGIRISEKEGII